MIHSLTTVNALIKVNDHCATSDYDRDVASMKLECFHQPYLLEVIKATLFNPYLTLMTTQGRYVAYILLNNETGKFFIGTTKRIREIVKGYKLLVTNGLQRDGKNNRSEAIHAVLGTTKEEHFVISIINNHHNTLWKKDIDAIKHQLLKTLWTNENCTNKLEPKHVNNDAMFGRVFTPTGKEKPITVHGTLYDSVEHAAYEAGVKVSEILLRLHHRKEYQYVNPPNLATQAS